MEPDLVLVSNTREWLLRAKEDLDNAQHDLMATPPFVREQQSSRGIESFVLMANTKSTKSKKHPIEQYGLAET